MGRILGSHGLDHTVHHNRLHPREEEDTQGPQATCIPQGKQPQPHVPTCSPSLLFPSPSPKGHTCASHTNTRSPFPQWLVSRAELARVDPRYAYPQSTYTNYRPGYYQQYPPGYNMQNMPPPPPMYDPSAPRPPMYDGPQGGSKLAPTQDYEAPPPGPPPAQRNDTGSSNPFRG